MIKQKVTNTKQLQRWFYQNNIFDYMFYSVLPNLNSFILIIHGTL